MDRRYITLTAVGAVVLLLGTAAASALLTRQMVEENEIVSASDLSQRPPLKNAVSHKSTAQKTKASSMPWQDGRQYAAQSPSAGNTQPPARQATAPACDDGNVLGYVAGGAAGALVGSQVGKGKGNTAAIIGGTLGGAYLGGQHLPLRNSLCNN